MKKYIFAAMVIFLMGLAIVPLRSAETCFSSGEKQEGLNKICFYKCPSGAAAITVRSTDLCPLSIER